MSELIENLIELVNMIFGVLVTPNYGAENTNYNLLRWLFVPSTTYTFVRSVILLTFGIMVLGASIGILKRFLWKN